MSPSRKAGSSTFRDAILPAGGDPRLVDRIEIEVTECGHFRWLLWHAGQRIYTTAVDRDDLPGMLKASGQLLKTTALARKEGLDDGTPRKPT